MMFVKGSSNAEEIREFADWILKIDDGNIGGNGDGENTIVSHDNRCKAI